MDTRKRLEEKYDWAREEKRRFFSQPYSFLEALNWVKNRLWGPSAINQGIVSALPQHVVLNPISPKLKLVFIGDIMPIRGKKFRASTQLKDFVADADYLIGNFEGTFVDQRLRKVFMALPHKQDVFELLEDLLPAERTILSCANNHAGDFGWKQFHYSYEYLRDKGYKVFGRRDEPGLWIDNQVNIVSGTAWQNQPSPFVSKLEDAQNLYEHAAEINIFYPHWGYEFQLFPRPEQLNAATKWLQNWDAIIGHHSHNPQPVTTLGNTETRQLVAYSLGGFSFGYNIRKVLYGIVLSIGIGPLNNGKWAVGTLKWAYTYLNFKKKQIQLQFEPPFAEMR